MHFDIRQIKHLNLGLDLSFIETVYTYAKNSDKEQATTGKVINGKYTTEYNKWCTANFVNYTEFVTHVDIIKQKCVELIESNFNVKCLSNEIHFLHYTDGAEYKPHIDGQYIQDGIAKRGINRDITSVVYLNDDYIGGEVNFNFFDLKVKPKQNEVLIYPTTWQYTHSVDKVIGNRYAIVFWFETSPQINTESEIKDKNISMYLQSLINH